MSWSRFWNDFFVTHETRILTFLSRRVIIDFTLSKQHILIIWYAWIIDISMLYNIEHAKYQKDVSFMSKNHDLWDTEKS